MRKLSNFSGKFRADSKDKKKAKRGLHRIKIKRKSVIVRSEVYCTERVNVKCVKLHRLRFQPFNLFPPKPYCIYKVLIENRLFKMSDSKENITGTYWILV